MVMNFLVRRVMGASDWRGEARGIGLGTGSEGDRALEREGADRGPGEHERQIEDGESDSGKGGDRKRRDCQFRPDREGNSHIKPAALQIDPSTTLFHPIPFRTDACPTDRTTRTCPVPGTQSKHAPSPKNPPALVSSRLPCLFSPDSLVPCPGWPLP